MHRCTGRFLAASILALGVAVSRAAAPCSGAPGRPALGGPAQTTPAVPLAEANFSLDFKVTFQVGSGKVAAWVAFCATPKRDGYELRLTNSEASLARLEKGRRTALLSGLAIATRPTAPVDVTLVRRDAGITVWVNNELIGSVRDTTFSTGAIAYGVTGSEVEISHFQYSPLSAREYESDPDELLVYASGQAMATDHLAFPGGKTVRLVLPIQVDRGSIEIVDSGSPVKVYRVVDDPLAAMASGAGGVGALTEGLTIEWDGPSAGMREAVVRYVVNGLSWSPDYRLDVPDGGEAVLTLNVTIKDSALDVSDAKVSVVSGVSGGPPSALSALSQLAAAVTGSVPALTGKSVAPDAYHAYALPGTHGISKNGAITTELFRQELSCSSRFEWDATAHDRVAVVYRIANTTPYPWAGGTVEVYRDGGPIGRDQIGWTPVGNDVDLSIVGATTIRASVDSSVEQQAGRGYKQEYRHTYTYELLSPTAAEVELIARKPRDAADMQLDPPAASETEDEYHWLLKLAPREATKVTVQFNTDSRMAQPLAGR